MKKLLLALLFVLLLFSSCSVEDDEDKISIIATLFPQYDMAHAIAGEYASVEMLLPFGSESHGYEPSIEDMKKISNCDIFIYTGDQMESWAAGAAEQAKKQGAIVVDLSEVADILMIEPHDHDENDHQNHAHNIDPHIWLDLQNAQKMVLKISDTLCQFDENNADIYTETANAYISELIVLDERLSNFSMQENKQILCFGGKFAYSYLLNKYGFEYVSAFQDCSEGAEPSASDIAHVINTITNNDLNIVYFEELSDAKVAKSISEATGAKLYLLHSCHNISLEDHENGVTFLDLMRSNVDNIEKGLFD